jgi:hypothetical protein
MVKFKITYVQGDPRTEEVEADYYQDQGDEWTDFYANRGGDTLTIVLRVRQKAVVRIEALKG